MALFAGSFEEGPVLLRRAVATQKHRFLGKKFDRSEQPRLTLGGAKITFIDPNFCALNV